MNSDAYHTKTPLSAILLAVLAFLVPLGVFALIGLQTRYWADDYCFSASLQEHGFWPAQAHFYQTTSSRYLVILMVALSELFGVQTISWIPLINLAFLGLAFFACLRALGRLAGLVESDWVPLMAGLGLLFFLVLLAPNRLQAFYWRSGLLTYSFPISLLLFNLSGLLNVWRRSRATLLTTVLAFVLALLAGGASETFVALQTAVLGLLGLILLSHPRGRRRHAALTWLTAALVGSLLALVVLVLSPANAYRQAIFPAPPSLFGLLGMSFSNAARFVGSSLLSLPVPHVVLFLFGAFFGLRLPVQRGGVGHGKALLGILAITYVLLVAVVSPSAYAQSTWPEARALILARLVLVVGVFALGLLLAWMGRDALGTRLTLFQSTWLSLSLLLALSFYPLRSAWQELPAVEPAQQWARAWEARHAYLLNQPASGLVHTVQFDSLGRLLEIGPDPTNWVNVCAARYYQLEAIRATPP